MREIVERLQEQRQVERAKAILESNGYKVTKGNKKLKESSEVLPTEFTLRDYYEGNDDFADVCDIIKEYLKTSLDNIMVIDSEEMPEYRNEIKYFKEQEDLGDEPTINQVLDHPVAKFGFYRGIPAFIIESQGAGLLCYVNEFSRKDKVKESSRFRRSAKKVTNEGLHWDDEESEEDMPLHPSYSLADFFKRAEGWNAEDGLEADIELSEILADLTKGMNIAEFQVYEDAMAGPNDLLGNWKLTKETDGDNWRAVNVFKGDGGKTLIQAYNFDGYTILVTNA